MCIIEEMFERIREYNSKPKPNKRRQIGATEINFRKSKKMIIKNQQKKIQTT